MSIHGGTLLPINFAIAGSQFISKLIGWLNMPSVSGVRIESYKYREELTSKISEQMIINLDGSGKNIVNDNIVPIPRKWTIEGYIGSATVAFAIATNPPNSKDLAGGVNDLINGLKQFTEQTGIPLPGFEPNLYFMPSLKLQVQVLRNAWLNYKLIWFRDKEGIYIPVGIDSLSFDYNPEIANKVPVSITLKEIIVYNGFNTTLNDSGLLVPDITNSASSYVSLGGGTPNFVSTGIPSP